ncbi:hypothetical protein Tco_0824907 [Tanacetum coccineum]
MAEGLSGRMQMEHKDVQGQRLHTAKEIETVRIGAYWAESARQIPNKGDLRDYWIWISSAGDFLGITPSYTSIRDPILRLYHRLIAYSIVGRSHAPEKVTVTDLFYLRGMDIDSVNVPYLLARYLRLFALGRKQGAMIFEVRELLVIDMDELPDATAGALGDAEDAPAIVEGALAVPTPVHAPQHTPPPAGRTMP